MYVILISMTSEMSIACLRALGDPTRMHIVQFLSQRCCGEATLTESGGVEGPSAGEVCCHITGLEKVNSTISHHLHELESVGIIRMERRGKAMLCTLRPETLKEIAAHLMLLAQGESRENCCC